jgi:hypothetical protein
VSYPKSTSILDSPISRNSASGTAQISSWWIKRLKK